MSLTTPSCAVCPRLPLQAMADDEPATDVEAMLEGNEEVVQLQLRAGNISSGRPAGQCAKEQKKRDASEQSTEEAPSSEEVEVAPRRFDGTMQPGWGFLMPKSSSLSPPPPASTAPGKGATAAPAPKKAKVSHETMSKTEQTVIVESFFSTYQMSKTGRRYDTVDADSHDNWAAYHVLKAAARSWSMAIYLLTSRGPQIAA